MCIGATAAELVSGVNAGTWSAVAIAKAFLDRIDTHETRINAFLNVDRANVLGQAAAVDEKRKAGRPLGKLAGVPVALEDLVCTRGQATTCASRILAGFVPPYDAEIVRRLRAADAVILGKTNMDEFAMGSSTENSAFKTTRNPWDTERAGGFERGFGRRSRRGHGPTGSWQRYRRFDPSAGRILRHRRTEADLRASLADYGMIAYASSLDQLGPMAPDVASAGLLLEVIAGHDPRDSTSVDQPVPEYSRTIDQSLSGLRIGMAQEHFAIGLDAEVESVVRRAADVYRSLGAAIVDVNLPHSKYSVAAYYLIAPSEAASNLARYDGVHYGHRAAHFEGLVDMYAASRGEGFGDEVKRRIMLGNYALSAGYYDAYYLKALKVRRLIRTDFDRAFEKCDAILSPVTPTAAFKVGELVDDPLAMYLSDIYTISANLSGLPGISVPAGLSSSGLPIGLQLVGPPFAEETLLRAARMFEKETPWHTKRPSL